MNRLVFDNIELPATDLVAAKAFYVDVFGWRWTDYGPSYAAANASGTEIGLSSAATVAETPPAEDESSVGPLLLFRTDDLDAALAAIEPAGGRILTRPFGFPGGHRFHFTDPSGNVLGIYVADAGAS